MRAGSREALVYRYQTPIALSLSGGHGPRERPLVRYPTTGALATENSLSAFCDVQPTAMLGRAMDLQPTPNLFRLRRLEDLTQ